VLRAELYVCPGRSSRAWAIEVFEGPEGAKIYVDKKSLLFLNGTVLRLRHEHDQQGVRVQQSEREIDLRLWKAPSERERSKSEV